MLGVPDDYTRSATMASQSPDRGQLAFGRGLSQALPLPQRVRSHCAKLPSSCLNRTIQEHT